MKHHMDEREIAGEYLAGKRPPGVRPHKSAGGVPGKERERTMTQSIIAAGLAFVLTLVIGRFLIPELRKLKAGQEIRADGPTWHMSCRFRRDMGFSNFL